LTPAPLPARARTQAPSSTTSDNIPWHLEPLQECRSAQV